MKRYLYQCLLMAVLLAISLSSVVQAGDDVDKKVKNLPKLLGSTNVGTEFYMTFLTAWPVAGGKNNIKLYVSSGVETEVIVEVKASGFIQKKKTKPNDIIEFTLSVTDAQPYFKTDRDPTPKEAVYRQQAVHVISKDPIIVYGVTRYQYTSDGFLALPVSALGKEYIVASYGDVGDNGTSFGQYMPSQSFIVAPYDGTKVAFTLGGNLITRTPGGMRVGQTKTWTLNKGDVLAMASFGNAADLSGSKIVATKPIGVVSGNFCAYIPINIAACDVIEEMELPTNTWGTAYHVTKIFGRQKNSIIKIFAKEPNTKVYINGQHKNTIQTSGGTEGIGFIERRPDEGEPGNFIISADKPISVTQYNPGQQDDNISSDPFQIILTPIEQFQNEITFNTPGIGDGAGFARNYINVVFQLDEKGQMPEGLEFATVDNGQFEWESLGAKYGSFFDGFNSEVNGKAYGMKTVKLPGDGVYKIRSPYPFAAYAYGFADYDSYGFPTSVALGDLTKPDTVAPVVTYEKTCEACYKNVQVLDMPDDPAIRSNLAQVRMDEANSTNYEFSVKEFVAGEDPSTLWSACPIDKKKDGLAILIFIDRAGNETRDTLVYKPFNVSILPENPITLDFGTMKLGNSKTEKLTIQNNSELNAVTIEKLELSNSVGFEIVNPPTLPFTLEAKGQGVNTKEIEIKFTATVPSDDVDPKDGKLDPFRTEIIVGNECSTVKKPMQVIVGTSEINVTDIPFGKVPVGATSTKQFFIENKGKSPLTVTKRLNDPAQTVFKIKTDDSQPGFYPIVIQPGERSQPFDVEFAPTAKVQYSDQVEFESDADAGDNVALLTGEGIEAGFYVEGNTWEVRMDLDEEVNAPTNTKKVTLGNSDEVTVGIQSITIVEASNPHFEIQNGIIGNNAGAIPDLRKEDTFTFNVTFKPKDIGVHTLHLLVRTRAGKEETIELTGTSLYAALATEDVSFGTLNITGGPATSVRDVTFTAASGEFARGIEVTDFVFANNPNNPAGNSFSYDVDPRTEIWANGVQIAETDLPVVIQPGQTLQIRNAVYAPTVASPLDEASFTVVTVDNTRAAQNDIDPMHTRPADARPTSDWSGVAIFNPTGEGIVNAEPVTFPLTCVNGVTANLFSDVTNVGDADITVETITLEPVSGEFSIVNTPTLPLTLTPNDPAERVEVGFTPTGTGDRGPVYLVFRDAGGKELARAKVEGSADEYATTIQLSRKDEEVQPGSDFELTVKNSNTVAALGAFNKMRVTISYDGTVVKGLDVVPTGNYNVANVTETGNTFSFDLIAKNPGSTFNAEDLATIKFRAYLASNKLTQLNLTVSDVDAGCLTIDGSTTVVKIGKVCAIDLRAISTSGIEFQMDQNYPNPSGGQTTIDFSVGFEAPTSIVLYNSMGEMVETLVDQPLKAGAYQLDLSTVTLPSGVYHYRITSGPYTETKQMVISK